MHQPSASSGHHVLIVDDEPSIRYICRRYLQDRGLACDEAVNGAQALERARGKPYDLVLLDIDMPVLNGWDVCRQLRAHPPVAHQKIIMFSGRASGDELATMMLEGADDYLTKP